MKKAFLLNLSMQNWEFQNHYALEEFQIQDLESYAAVNNPISAIARKLLLLNGETILDRPYYFSDDEPESEPKQPRTFSVEGMDVSKFSLYPNPAINFVTLDYTIVESGEERKVVLVNTAGKLVKTMKLANSRDQVVLKLNNLPQGDYVCFIIVNGKSIGSKKITVIK